MNVLVVHNASSGAGDGAIYDFMRSYAEEGDSITIRTFGSHCPLSKALQDAERFDFVVACGGDGSVAACAYELRYTDIPILVFPSGTANLLALNLLMPEEPHAISKIADQATTLDFDLGEIESAEGRFGFAIMAGCGYDHRIMQDAAANKRLLGPMAYYQAAVANPTPQHSRITLTIDGHRIETEGIGVVVANFSKIQFDVMISEDNPPNDGAFDVVVLKTQNAVELLPTLFAKVVDRTGGMAKRLGALDIYRGRDVTIDADPAMLIEYDGEPSAVSTPVRMRNLHDAARFVVSQECYDLFVHADEQPKAPVNEPDAEPTAVASPADEAD